MNLSLSLIVFFFFFFFEYFLPSLFYVIVFGSFIVCMGVKTKVEVGGCAVYVVIVMDVITLSLLSWSH